MRAASVLPIAGRAIAAVVVIASAAPRAAADVIRDIVVEGNTKTTSDTVQLIARVDVGDDFSPALLDRIKADLVSSGLFKEADAFWEPCGPTTQPRCDEPGIRVHLNVKDKHSWVVAPAIYDQPTNKGAGVGYGENNLFGENQKLLLYAQIATGDSFFVGAWVIPSINGTRFYAQFDTYLKSSRVIEYAPPTGYIDNPDPVRQSREHYLNGGVKLGVELLRGFKLDARLRGAYVDYPEVIALTSTPGAVPLGPDGKPVKPGKEGWDISNELGITIDRRADFYGIQSGYQLHASYEYAVPQLGSDFHYHSYNFSFYKALRVLESHNFVIKGDLDIGHNLPFQQELTMGGTSMRGYLNDQFRGDFHAGTTLEYSVPIITVYGLSIRGLGFLDSGYTTFPTTSNPERNYLPGSARSDAGFAAPFKNTVGLGTRLYLRQIVIPLLGLDFGYGLEARDLQIYLAIGLTN